MIEVLLELTALLALWLCLATWQRDRTVPGRRLFIALSASVFLWCAGGLAAEAGALDPQVARLSCLGMLAVPGLWLSLALVIRGSPGARRPWGLALILVPGAAAYTLHVLGPEHVDVSIASGAVARNAADLGWLFAGYAWCLGVVGSIQFGASARSLRQRSDRVRRVVLAGGCAAAVAVNAAYVSAGLPGPDVTPVLLGALLVALRSELFSGDLLQAVPLSQLDLMSQLPIPLILTDPADRITAINPAALACLAIARADALDRNALLMLEEASFAPHFERFALVARGREVGGILVPAQPKDGGPR
jgi:PAS domain-containing protein